jgi:hypothetical protein
MGLFPSIYGIIQISTPKAVFLEKKDHFYHFLGILTTLRTVL